MAGSGQEDAMASSRAECLPARSGSVFSSTSSLSFIPSTSHVTSSPITNHESLITVFLIDTPAIRIAPKSFHCSVAMRSNRHSSGAFSAPFLAPTR